MMREFRRARRRNVPKPVAVFDLMTEQVIGRVGNLSESGMLLVATEPVVDDALRDRLAGQFDARALTELTALIGLQNLSARFNSAMAIPAQGLCRIPTDSKP